MNRREMLKTAGTGLAGVSLMGIDAFGRDSSSSASGKGRKKVLVIGAHPDDPESMAGGTMAKLAKEGHDVVSVYMTHGERGIDGVSLDEAARIRTQEGIEACKVLGCRPVFLTQIDGAAEITPERYKEFIDLMTAEKPDIVITHWPIDTHRDHAICSILTIDAWNRCKRSFDLYFTEVLTGRQTRTFSPTVLVDITDEIDLKTKACYCHKSQDPHEWYDDHHRAMERFNGYSLGVEYAEAFVRLTQSPTRVL